MRQPNKPQITGNILEIERADWHKAMKKWFPICKAEAGKLDRLIGVKTLVVQSEYHIAFYVSMKVLPKDDRLEYTVASTSDPTVMAKMPSEMTRAGFRLCPLFDLEKSSSAETAISVIRMQLADRVMDIAKFVLNEEEDERVSPF